MQQLLSKKIWLSLVCFFFLSFSFAQQVSQPRSGNTGTWRLLGTPQAKFTADHDAVFISGPYDFFGRLNLK